MTKRVLEGRVEVRPSVFFCPPDRFRVITKANRVRIQTSFVLGFLNMIDSSVWDGKPSMVAEIKN